MLSKEQGIPRSHCESFSKQIVICGHFSCAEINLTLCHAFLYPDFYPSHYRGLVLEGTVSGKHETEGVNSKGNVRWMREIDLPILPIWYCLYLELSRDIKMEDGESAGMVWMWLEREEEWWEDENVSCSGGRRCLRLGMKIPLKTITYCPEYIFPLLFFSSSLLHFLQVLIATVLIYVA